MEEIKYILVIETLRKLGYTNEQIVYGINALNEDKYTEFNLEEITQDIINNIEQGNKE